MFRYTATLISIALLLCGVATAQISSLATINAVEGQCFTRVVSQNVAETYDVRVETSPEKIQQVRIPAVYRTENVRVEIKQATTVLRVTPAVYETVTERVMVRPAREERVVIPARYETVSERVMVEPEKTVWKAGNGLYGRTAPPNASASSAVQMPNGETLTGEVMCRVIVPAQYRTVKRTVMVEPARTETRQFPASYRTITKAVVKTPARITEEVTPAKYITVPVQVMVEPERFEVETIPAVFETIKRQRIVPSTQWAEVLCDTNATGTKIAEIQRALARAGYFTAADRVFGPSTLAAMEAYQKDKALPIGYLTVETVRSLGVNPYT